MKKIKQMVLLCSILMACNFVFAQNEGRNSRAKHPRWVSEKGFWVIETNVKTPKIATVRFYNNDRQLVYTEKVEGRKLKVKRKRILVQLKNAVDKVMYAWEQNGVVKDLVVLAPAGTKQK